jgi:hypothetical protein
LITTKDENPEAGRKRGTESPKKDEGYLQIRHSNKIINFVKLNLAYTINIHFVVILDADASIIIK